MGISLKNRESTRGKILSQKLQLLGFLQIDFTTISHKTLWRNQKHPCQKYFLSLTLSEIGCPEHTSNSGEISSQKGILLIVYFIDHHLGYTIYPGAHKKLAF